jgi:SAM-dependent methyltransferase
MHRSWNSGDAGRWRRRPSWRTIGPMATVTRTFLPALAFDALTPLYDAVIALTMRERAFKRRLVEQARLAPGQRVLDLGCGTGTLALMLARAEPRAAVVGLDVDPRILGRARRKAARAGIAVDWTLGSAVAPPFPAASFDRVTSSLVLHHLTTPEKQRALAAIRRILRPGGELHVADFGRPDGAYARLAASLFRCFDGPERTAANLEGRLPALVGEAGFVDVAETERWTTPFGTLAFLRARTPAGDAIARRGDRPWD